MLSLQINILCNMAEMVVRHVEKAWVAEIRRNTALCNTANPLKRSPASLAASYHTTRVEDCFFYSARLPCCESACLRCCTW